LSELDKFQQYERWLIDTVKQTQMEACTCSENVLRKEMAEKFGITEAWAFEVIRKIVSRYPEFHLEKVKIELPNGKTLREFELMWCEGESWEIVSRTLSKDDKIYRVEDVCDKCLEKMQTAAGAQLPNKNKEDEEYTGF